MGLGLRVRMLSRRYSPRHHTHKPEADAEPIVERRRYRNNAICPQCRLPVKTYGATMHRRCLESTRAKKKPKALAVPRVRCSKGHLLSRYGYVRHDRGGGIRCRKCESDRALARYHRQKEAAK